MEEGEVDVSSYPTEQEVYYFAVLFQSVEWVKIFSNICHGRRTEGLRTRVG